MRAQSTRLEAQHTHNYTDVKLITDKYKVLI